MPKQPEESVERAWIALLRARDTVFSHLERTLKENELPPFSWYDVLWELEKVGNEGLRPYEIERRLLLTQYGLSRLLDRLDKAGFVEKTPSMEDGRGYSVSITGEGKKIRRETWKVYSRTIQTTIGDKLTRKQCRQLIALLSPLMAGEEIDRHDDT